MRRDDMRKAWVKRGRQTTRSPGAIRWEEEEERGPSSGSSRAVVESRVVKAEPLGAE